MMTETDSLPEDPEALRLESIEKRYGDAVAADDVSITIPKGEFFTFLGSSGSGKSTLLRIVAGLETPDAGRVILEGNDISRVPPWERPIGMIFQHYALFPHMNVAENVAYGLKLRKTPKEEIASRVPELLELVGLSGFEKRKVTVLSGGEQQRVALARALAPRPEVLLLDEPLGALDEKVRRQMQTELKRIHASTGTTFLYVTHDQEEALTMSDRIAVFHQGVLQQCATPDDVFYRPSNSFVASFFRGWNLVRVASRREVGGLADLLGVDVPIGSQDAEGGGVVGWRAEHCEVGVQVTDRLAVLPATVLDVQYRGALVDYLMRLSDGQHVTATTTKRLKVEVGDATTLGVNPDDIIALDEVDLPPAAGHLG